MLNDLFCLFDILPIISIFATGNIAKELNLKVMSEVNLRITVERPDKLKPGSFKLILHQTLSFDSAVSIPFSDIYHGLRLLFPYDDAIVHFYV